MQTDLNPTTMFWIVFLTKTAKLLSNLKLNSSVVFYPSFLLLLYYFQKETNQTKKPLKTKRSKEIFSVSVFFLLFYLQFFFFYTKSNHTTSTKRTIKQSVPINFTISILFTFSGQGTPRMYAE